MQGGELADITDTLQDLATYKKEHPEQILFGKAKLELAYQFRGSWISSCFDKIGIFDEKKYEQINDERYCYELASDKKKKQEILDVAEGKTQLVAVTPYSLDKVAEVAEILKARDDIMVKNLMSLDNTAVYIAGGILGINESSENKNVAKEIIKIALGEEMQRLDSKKGMPINMKVQEENNKNLMAYPSIYNEFKKCVEEAKICVNNIDRVNYWCIMTETEKYCRGEQTIEEAINTIKSKIEDNQDISYYN